MAFLIAILGMSCAVLAVSLPVLLVAAAAGGCSLAMSASVTNKAVGQYVDGTHRGWVLSTKQMGVQFAQIVAGFLFLVVAAAFGWRMGLVSGVAVSLLALILILLTTKQSFIHQVTPPVVAMQKLTTENRGNSWMPIAMVFYALVTAICFQSNLSGLPLMGYEVLDFEVQEASKVVVVLGAVGFVARLVWGRYADRRFRIWVVMLVLSAGLLIGEATISLAVFAHLQWLFWIGAEVVGTFFALVPVVLCAVILQNFPVKWAGFNSGVISVSTFGGFATGSLIFGTFVDKWSYFQSSLVLVVVSVRAVLTSLLFAIGACAQPGFHFPIRKFKQRNLKHG